MSAEALIIREGGKMTAYPPRNGKTLQLEEMQYLVGGHIEIVTLGDGFILVVNEEGKLQKDCKYNEQATILAMAYRALGAGDWIAGDAILCPATMVK